jgi:hypothetical protein
VESIYNKTNPITILGFKSAKGYSIDFDKFKKVVYNYVKAKLNNLNILSRVVEGLAL